MIRAARICLFLFFAAAVALSFFCAVADAGHCHARRVVAIQHHQAYVAPVVQNVFYSVGQGVQLEAAVQKAVRQELAQWKSLETGKPVVPAEEKPAAGSLLNAKCAKCHDNFDGKQAIDCETYKKFDAFYMATHNGLQGTTVPAKMQPVIQALSEVDFLNIKAEMHGLVKEGTAEDEPGVLK